MNVMLLAAGEGTRLRPYTLQLPKPAIPFLNVPLAGHALGFLGSTPVDRLVVNTFHLPTKVHNLFRSLSHGARELHFSDEIGEILGNGGGLGKAQDHFLGGGDFILMNSDEVILPVDSEVVQKAISHHKSSKAFATLLVTEHPGVGTQFGGAWADSKNKVQVFGKQGLAVSDKGWHFVGVQILSEKVFDYIPKDGPSNILYDVVTAAMKDGHTVQVFPFECKWFETGNPKDFFSATEKCLEILAQKEVSTYQTALVSTFKKFLQTQNKLLQLPNGKILSATTTVLPESIEIKGFVCAGPDSKIGTGCSLENVIIAPSIQVPPNSTAKNTLLL